MTQDTETNGSEFYRLYDLIRARATTAPKDPAAHQRAALEKLARWYGSSSLDPSGAILALPTGGGKTFTAVRFACCHPLSDGFKVLWLAHTHHLLEQALKSFDENVAWIAEPKSQLAVRVVSGATGHFQIQSIRASDDLVIGSLQAVAKAASNQHESLNAFLMSANGKLVVVFDEAHHAPAPSFRRLLQQLKDFCPGMMLLGLTATPTYTDDKKRGWLAKLFPQGIVHQETPQNLMAVRVLAQPVFEEARTNFEPDFTDREYAKWVGTNRDIPEETISYLATSRSRNEYIAGYYVEHRERFGKTLIFADRWAQCEAICTLLRSRGVRADSVFAHVVYTYGTPEERNRRTASENAKILKRFRDGELDVLVNVRMLTEGTDVPDVNTVFLTRQTTSRILLTQMIGRALRGPAFGGTERAYIVSFIDDWKQRINWAAYEQIAEGQVDSAVPEYGKRPPIQLISIDLIRRLARQMDSGVNTNPAPFRSFLPVGWYRADFDAQVGETDDIEPVRQLILVYEHDKPRFDRFIEALKGENLHEFEENSVLFDDARPRLEAWEGRFFTETEQRIGLALVNDMFSIVRHMAQNDKTAPAFFSFESRQSHDLDAVAERFIADNLGFVAANESLSREFVRSDRFWKVIYPRYEQFKSSFDACINRLLQIRRNGSESADHARSYTQPEQIPDREPSDELKEQVKSRDHHRCLCCGATRKLQADHVAPSYVGGRNHLDNLQTLCGACNSAKSNRRIVFRTNQTILTCAPTQEPKLPLPSGHFATDAEKWEQFLRRWINFFYQCAVVDTVEVGEKGERLRVWFIRLFPGNNPAWLAPQLDSLVHQIREARQNAGYVAAPDTIRLNELPVAAPPSAPEDGGDEPEGLSKLGELPAHYRDKAEKQGDAPVTLDDVLVEIERVEGFRIRISNRDGRKVRGDWTKGIQPYPYANALNGEVTTDTWKNSRCLKNYPVFESTDFIVEVIDGAGYVCAGQRKLRTVRQSCAR